MVPGCNFDQWGPVMTVICEVFDPAEAELTVEVVQRRAIADLLVHIDNSKRHVGHTEAIWSIVEERKPLARRIMFTEKPGLARLKVCFVDSPVQAGWVRNHALKGRLH